MTGHEGYIGSVLLPILQAQGHEVAGLGSNLIGGDTRPPPTGSRAASLRPDICDVTPAEFAGADVVVHLAGLRNSRAVNRDDAAIDAVNHKGTARLVHAASDAGVRHIVFVSSCAVYGARKTIVNETSQPAPITAYARSKVAAEEVVLGAATGRLRTTVLRGATAYGVSPHPRPDLFVNGLVTAGLRHGVVRLRSPGTAWRPFIHVADFCSAIVAVVEAPDSALRHRCYNVGSDSGNYRLVDVARAVAARVEARLIISHEHEEDARDYRVSFARLYADLPDLQFRNNLAKGIAELENALSAGEEARRVR